MLVFLFEIKFEFFYFYLFLFFWRLHFGHYAVLQSQIFTRVTDWPRLLSPSPNWDGGPPKFYSQKFKIWLEIKYVSLNNFGASENILTKVF